MSVSFDNVATLQSATSHQCSRDADGHGEGGRNGYPSDSVKAALTEKFYVAEPEDHDRTRVEEFDSGEAPCPTSEGDDSEEEEADSSDGEGVGATLYHIKCDHPACVSADGGHFEHMMVVALYMAQLCQSCR